MTIALNSDDPASLPDALARQLHLYTQISKLPASHAGGKLNYSYAKTFSLTLPPSEASHTPLQHDPLPIPYNSVNPLPYYKLLINVMHPSVP